MCIFCISIEYHPKAENIQKANFIYTEYMCIVSIIPKQHKPLSSSHLVPWMDLSLPSTSYSAFIFGNELSSLNFCKINLFYM